MVMAGFSAQRSQDLAGRLDIQAKAHENCCFTFGPCLISPFALHRPGDDSQSHDANHCNQNGLRNTVQDYSVGVILTDGLHNRGRHL